MVQFTICAHNDPSKISFLYTSQPAWCNQVALVVPVWPQATRRRAATRRYKREYVRHMHSTNEFVVQSLFLRLFHMIVTIATCALLVRDNVREALMSFPEHHHQHHRLQDYNQFLKERSAVSVLVTSVEDFARVAARGRDSSQGRQAVEEEVGVIAVMVRSCEHIYTRRRTEIDRQRTDR